eukprot:COSAG01_NODE_59545_length_299_cov_3.940000_1_plen_76_part_01
MSSDDTPVIHFGLPKSHIQTPSRYHIDDHRCQQTGVYAAVARYIGGKREPVVRLTLERDRDGRDLPRVAHATNGTA